MSSDQANRPSPTRYAALGAAQYFPFAPSEATLHLLTQQWQQCACLVTLRARWVLPMTSIYELLISGARRFQRHTLALMSDHDRALGDELQVRDRARSWYVGESLRRARQVTKASITTYNLSGLATAFWAKQDLLVKPHDRNPCVEEVLIDSKTHCIACIL